MRSSPSGRRRTTAIKPLASPQVLHLLLTSEKSESLGVARGTMLLKRKRQLQWRSAWFDINTEQRISSSAHWNIWADQSSPQQIRVDLLERHITTQTALPIGTALLPCSLGEQGSLLFAESTELPVTFLFFKGATAVGTPATRSFDS